MILDNNSNKIIISSVQYLSGDNECIVVSDFVFQNLPYGLVKIPEPPKVKTMLDKLERQSVE